MKEIKNPLGFATTHDLSINRRTQETKSTPAAPSVDTTEMRMKATEKLLMERGAMTPGDDPLLTFEKPMTVEEILAQLKTASDMA